MPAINLPVCHKCRTLFNSTGGTMLLCPVLAVGWSEEREREREFVNDAQKASA